MEGIASVYTNLGAIHYALLNYDSCIYFFNQALEIYEKYNDAHGVSRIYGNLEVLYKYKGEYNKAIEYYRKALEIKKN
ncbi:MAG: hypothetical protein Kow0068_16850 [Marinilabiliales bacterium]